MKTWALVSIGCLLCVPVVVISLRKESADPDSECERRDALIPLAQVHNRVEAFVRNLEALTRSASKDHSFNDEYSRCVWGADSDQPESDCTATAADKLYPITLYGSPNELRSKALFEAEVASLREKRTLPACAEGASLDCRLTVYTAFRATCFGGKQICDAATSIRLFYLAGGTDKNGTFTAWVDNLNEPSPHIEMPVEWLWAFDFAPPEELASKREKNIEKDKDKEKGNSEGGLAR